MLRHTLAVLGLSLCLTGISSAADATFLATDQGDPNAISSFGTAGYDVFDSSLGPLEADPAGLTITNLAPSIYADFNPGYTQFENPQGGGLIQSGVLYYPGVTPGTSLDYVQLTFTATENYILGIYIDNADYPGISPSVLEVSGSGGDSGPINDTLTTRGNLFLFDISGNSGDVLDISGIASSASNPPASSGIGAITFETTSAPEPGTISLLLAGAVGLAWQRRRKQASL